MIALAARLTRWRTAAAVAALLAASTFFFIAYPSIRAGWYGASQFQDDTFYYLVTAKNFLRQGVFTFDGRNATNGFQPLWMTAVVGLYTLIGPESPLDLQIFTVNLLEKAVLGVALASSVAAFVSAFRREQPWAAGYLALSLVLLSPFYFVFDQGMETTLAVLLLLIVTYAFLSERLLLLGISLALLFLTRLDTAVFVAAPLLAWTLASAPRSDHRRWIAVAIFGATFLAYVGVNLIATGHAVPISGAIRSSFPVVRWQGAFFTEPITLARMFGWWSLLQGINIVESTGLALAGLILTLAARPAPDERNKLLALATVSAALIANLLMFQKWDKSLDPRYLAMPMAMATMLFASALTVAVDRARSLLVARSKAKTRDGRARGSSPMATLAGALPVALILVLMLAEALVQFGRFASHQGRPQDAIRQIFLEIASVLPRDAVVAGTDVGALAFWTQRRVINLDGVINNFEYQEYLRAGRLREYLRREGVTHLTTALWDREQTYTGRPIEPMYRHVLDPAAERGVDYAEHEFFVYSYLYGVYSDKIALTPADEVYRKFLGKNGIADTTYVVYRLPG
ncbi:MAG TPA: hypothetical protein VF814_15000 [Casimicrobiaceae bacterium]